jgi:hypothetical protein
MNATDSIASAGQLAPRGCAAPDRLDFWGDTCREITEMHKASERVLRLYQKFGCRFTVPSRQQVQSVLEALDSALPQWEKQHPELFYTTLELNFPELVRHA